MIQDEIKKFEPFWNKWYVVERLGGGSYGDVYKIKREEYGEVYYSALKTISIPKNKEELNEASLSCGTKESTRTYFDNVRQNIVKEINLMERLKGKTNIVSYEDHEIIPKNDGKDPGYDIFIRMELLEDMGSVAAREISLFRDNKEIVKIGMDMCQALKLCHAQQIIHRDIKPGNIFRSQDGDYKLGDFGIARSFNDSKLTMSVKGTYDYMAPEVYNREHYDYRADIYSLGILLYSMLNGFRGPFLSELAGVPTVREKEDALIRRMQGEELPPPRFAHGKLAKAILKACAFDPNQRFSEITEFEEALYDLGEEDYRRTEQQEDSAKAGFVDDQKTPVVHFEATGEKPVAAEPVFKLEDERTVALDAINHYGEDDYYEEPSEGTVSMGYVEPEEFIESEELIEADDFENMVSPITAEGNTFAEGDISNGREKKKNGKIIVAAVIAGIVVLAGSIIGIQAFIGGGEKPAEEVYEASAEKEVQEEVQEAPVVPVTPVLADEITTKTVDRETALKEAALAGEFKVNKADKDTIPGILKWDQEDMVLEESGEYGWTFTPQDMEAYESVQGNAWVTVLINETVKGVEAVKAVKDKKSLVDVDLSDCGLEDLSILEGAENLKYLVVDNNNIASLEELKVCKQLRFVSAVGNEKLSDIAPLLKLKKLEAVFLDGTSVSSDDVKRIKKNLVEN